MTAKIQKDPPERNTSTPLTRDSYSEVGLAASLGTRWGDVGWAASLGPRWRSELGILAVLIAAAGTFAPLNDPDLPRHLATGDWILRQGALPIREPFSWTRMGAPFYAYSWLPSVAYSAIYSVLGAAGLRVLNGLLVVGAAAAMLVLGAVARWRVWPTLAMAALNLAVASIVSASLRPQIILFIAAPLAWAATMRARDSHRPWRAVIALAILSAITANSHLFFPILALPAITLLLAGASERRRIGVALLATMLSWLVSPYGLSWPAVFRLNLSSNPLLTRPTPISEFQPGFELLADNPGYFIIVALLALLPWWVREAELTVRERAAHAMLWFGGLALFAVAARALAIWWLAIIPLAAMVMARVGGPVSPRAIAINKAALFAGCIALATGRAVLSINSLGWRRAFSSAAISTPAGATSEPLAAWLECSTRPESHGRIFTNFNLGSHLLWRLPRYSTSIDGRTIFPDSIARAESYYLLDGGAPLVTAWSAADVVMLPTTHALTAVLDSATGWRRVAVAAPPREVAYDPVAAWVRQDWWLHAGAAPLPPSALELDHRSRGCRSPA